MTGPAVKRPPQRPSGKGPAVVERPVAKKAVPAQPAAKEKAESNNKGPSAAGLSCLCGCGQPTRTDKAKFIPGHDAKLKSLLLKIERGESKEKVPEIAKKFLQKSPLSGAWHFPTESGNTPDEDKHGGRTYAERKEEIEEERAAKKAARDKKLAELKAKGKKATKPAKAEEEEEEEEAEEEEE